MSYTFRRRREKTQAEINEEISKRWDERVKKKVNPGVERFKARTNLDILEFHEDNKIRMQYYTPDEQEETRLVELIQSTDPNFDKEQFEKYAEYVIRDFFNAFNNRKMDVLQSCVDINIIALFNSRLFLNKALNVQEMFKILDVNYVDFFGYQKEANLEIISVAVGMVFYTYKEKNGIIVDGSDKIKRRGTYLLSFARKIGGQTIKNDNPYETNGITCYNCGARIENSYNKCDYCGTIMYNSTENWLLNHIEKL